MKNVPPPQEEYVNVKPAYFKHTFKEPTALVINVFFLWNLTPSEQENMSLLTYNLDDCVIHVVRCAAYHASKHWALQL